MKIWGWGEGWARRGGRAEGRRLPQNASSELSCKEAFHVQPFSCPGYLKTARNPHSPRRPHCRPCSGRSVVPLARPSCLSEVSPPPPRPAGCGPFKGAPVWGRPALEADSGGAPARRAARHGHGVPGHRAAPVPAALGARTAALSAEPERPRTAAAAAAPGPLLAPLRPRAPLHCARGARETRCPEGRPGGPGAPAPGLPTRSPSPAWSAAETAAAAWRAPAPRRAQHLRAAAGPPRPGGARRGPLLRGTGAAGRPRLVRPVRARGVAAGAALR